MKLEKKKPHDQNEAVWASYKYHSHTSVLYKSIDDW